MSFKVNKQQILTVIIFIIIVALYAVYSKNKRDRIKQDGNNLIAKFIFIKKYVKSSDYFFNFYFKGIEKKCSVTVVPNNFSKNIGKFYYVKYLPKYPDLIIVNFNEEITDTKAILEAGFVKEDIKLHLTDKKNKHE